MMWKSGRRRHDHGRELNFAASTRMAEHQRNIRKVPVNIAWGDVRAIALLFFILGLIFGSLVLRPVHISWPHLPGWYSR